MGRYLKEFYSKFETLMLTGNLSLILKIARKNKNRLHEKLFTVDFKIKSKAYVISKFVSTPNFMSDVHTDGRTKI